MTALATARDTSDACHSLLGNPLLCGNDHFGCTLCPLLRVESLSQEGLLVMLDVNHMVGRYTRQRWLNPQDAHTWHRCLHHDGIAKLDTVHGGQTEASKIISVVRTDAPAHDRSEPQATW